MTVVRDDVVGISRDDVRVALVIGALRDLLGLLISTVSPPVAIRDVLSVKYDAPRLRVGVTDRDVRSVALAPLTDRALVWLLAVRTAPILTLPLLSRVGAVPLVARVDVTVRVVITGALDSGAATFSSGCPCFSSST